MSEPRPDPKVVLQAHALRAAASSDALLHGTRQPRTQRKIIGTLYGSAILTLIIIIVVVVAGKIIDLLHH